MRSDAIGRRNVATHSLTLRYPISVRMSHATAKNKAVTADEEQSPTQSARPAMSTFSRRPPTIQRLRSVTSTVADSQISKNTSRNELYSSLVACIEPLSNTMVQHRQHRPQGPHPNKPAILPPLDFLPLRFNSGPTNTPTLVPCLSTCSVGLQTRVPLRTNGVYQPLMPPQL